MLSFWSPVFFFFFLIFFISFVTLGEEVEFVLKLHVMLIDRWENFVVEQNNFKWQFHNPLTRNHFNLTLLHFHY